MVTKIQASCYNFKKFAKNIQEVNSLVPDVHEKITHT